MNIFTSESRSFLYQYLNNASPTGFEASGQQIWLDYMRPYIDSYISDAYGSVAGIINPNAAYKVVIEAHADEISWFVHYISEEGLIYVSRNGGSDHTIAPSKRVNIHTENGMIKAVFGWPAIHTRRAGEEPVPSLKNIFLDCGCTSKQEILDLGIHVGCVITYEDELIELQNRYFCGRALDNRMGGFMIAQVARLLKENDITLPFGLYIVNSVQEEVGLRGAEMIARTISPNVAIVTDVTHDTSTPLIDKVQHGEVKCGLGPSLTTGPAVQNNLLKLVVDTAKTHEIPFQREAASRSTGTDTDSFAYTNGGIPSCLISLPLRYMHTTVEMTAISDIENVVKLIYYALQNIAEGQDFRYIK